MNIRWPHTTRLAHLLQTLTLIVVMPFAEQTLPCPRIPGKGISSTGVSDGDCVGGGRSAAGEAVRIQHKGSKLYSPWISLGQVAASLSCMATHKAVRKQAGITQLLRQ